MVGRRPLRIALARLALRVALAWLALRVALAWLALHLLPALHHLLVPGTHLLTVLVALVVAQLTHELTPELSIGLTVRRGALRMRLRILVDHGLDALLLVLRQIEVPEAPCPMLLQARLARHRSGMARIGRSLTLLRIGT